MPKLLPSRPNLEQLRNQARDLLKQFRAGEPSAVERVREFHPQPPASSIGRRGRTDAKSGEHSQNFPLHDAQLVIAREYGFPSWRKLKEHVAAILVDTGNPMELLKNAFHEDDATMMRELLARHPQFKAMINEPVGPFDSPAVTNARSCEMLDVLLEAGADINAKSRWWAGGFGLLHGAERGLATYAIQRGAVVDIHAAARLGMIEKVRELIAADPSLIRARGGDGQTPLHFASTIEVAQFLLEHGADIDARDVDHESTAAQWMIRDRHEIARFLVQRGCKTDILMAAALGDVDLVCRHLDADPDCVRVRVIDEFFPMTGRKAGGTIYQWTLGRHVSAHDVAREFGHAKVFQLLMDRSPADVKLIAACWAADNGMVKALLAENPQIVGRLSPRDRCQIAYAAQNNNPGAVRAMLAAGLSVESLGQHRATPLHWAAFRGNAEMVHEILRFDPPLELKDSDFHGTPLGWAIHGSENAPERETGDYVRTVELLLKAGATIPSRIGGTEAVQNVLRGARQ